MLAFTQQRPWVDSFRELCDASPGPMAEATMTPWSAGSSGRPRPAAQPSVRPGRPRNRTLNASTVLAASNLRR